MKLRVAYGRTTIASVDIVLPDGTAQRVVTDIAVRDVLIAGLGDSIAAGEGNPDRPCGSPTTASASAASSAAARSEYFRPGRDGFTGNKSCEGDRATIPCVEPGRARARAGKAAPATARSTATRLRTALALAIESPHLAVTFLPLACSGATIERGLPRHPAHQRMPQPRHRRGLSRDLRARRSTS